MCVFQPTSLREFCGRPASSGCRSRRKSSERATGCPSRTRASRSPSDPVHATAIVKDIHLPMAGEAMARDRNGLATATGPRSSRYSVSRCCAQVSSAARFRRRSHVADKCPARHRKRALMWLRIFSIVGSCTPSLAMPAREASPEIVQGQGAISTPPFISRNRRIERALGPRKAGDRSSAGSREYEVGVVEAGKIGEDRSRPRHDRDLMRFAVLGALARHRPKLVNRDRPRTTPCRRLRRAADPSGSVA